MRNVSLLLAFVAALTYSAPVLAATVIESMDRDGTTNTMWVEGNQMRVEVSNESHYMLFDGANEKMYSVDPGEKKAIEMGSIFQNDSKKGLEKKYEAKFIKVGKGPEVAGYATEEYQFIVNEQKCGVEFLSTAALRNFESLDIFESLSKIGNSSRRDYAMQMRDPCDSAQSSFDKTYTRLGLPLRIIDKNGARKSEIIRITQKVSVPADWFAVPPGYEIVGLGQMMQQGMQGYYPGKGQGVIPPAGSDAMGKEGIDPEKLQQMMQEMMQQMGREK